MAVGSGPIRRSPQFGGGGGRSGGAEVKRRGARKGGKERVAAHVADDEGTLQLPGRSVRPRPDEEESWEDSREPAASSAAIDADEHSNWGRPVWKRASEPESFEIVEPRSGRELCGLLVSRFYCQPRISVPGLWALDADFRVVVVGATGRYARRFFSSRFCSSHGSINARCSFAPS